MKLSELTTDQALDKIVELTPYIEEIIKDKEINSIIKDKLKIEQGTKKEDILDLGVDKGIEKIVKLIPALLKTRRNAVYGIISVMNEKTIEEIANQSLVFTIKQITELLKDEELKVLFF